MTNPPRGMTGQLLAIMAPTPVMVQLSGKASDKSTAGDKLDGAWRV